MRMKIVSRQCGDGRQTDKLILLIPDLDKYIQIFKQLSKLKEII